MIPLIGGAVLGVGAITYAVYRFFFSGKSQGKRDDDNKNTSPPDASAENEPQLAPTREVQTPYPIPFRPNRFRIKESVESWEVADAASFLGIKDGDMALMLRSSIYTIQDYRNEKPILKTKRHYELCRTFVSLASLLERRIEGLERGNEEIVLWIADNLDEMKRSPPVQDFRQPGLDRAYFNACMKFGD